MEEYPLRQIIVLPVVGRTKFSRTYSSEICHLLCDVLKNVTLKRSRDEKCH